MPPRAEQPAEEVSDTTRCLTPGTGLRLVAYRPLFSGAAVERTPELDFQKPDAEIQLSREDAKARGIRNGQTRHRLVERHLGRAARARSRATFRPVSCASPRDHAGDLHATVEIKP